jgi:hypothetical protein
MKNKLKSKISSPESTRAADFKSTYKMEKNGWQLLKKASLQRIKILICASHWNVPSLPGGFIAVEIKTRLRPLR